MGACYFCEETMELPSHHVKICVILSSSRSFQLRRLAAHTVTLPHKIRQIPNSLSGGANLIT